MADVNAIRLSVPDPEQPIPDPDPGTVPDPERPVPDPAPDPEGVPDPDRPVPDLDEDRTAMTIEAPHRR